MKLVIALVLFHAFTPMLRAQTTWEIRSTGSWPIVDAVLDSIDGYMLAYDGVKRIHLDSISSLVPHRHRRGNPGGALLGLLAGGAVSSGIAVATFDIDGDRNDVATLLVLIPPIAGTIIGFMTKRDVTGERIDLSGLSSEQRRVTVSGALRDAALEDAAATATGR